MTWRISILLLISWTQLQSAWAGNPCTAPEVSYSHDTCFSGTTIFSTPSNINTLPCSGVNNGDIWYKFVVPYCNPTIAVKLTGGTVPGRCSNPILYLYSGSCDSLIYKGCFSTFPTDTITQDTVTGLSASDTVFIRVKPLGGTQNGAFDICIFGMCFLAGISEFSQIAAGPEIYPNPVSDKLKISLPQKTFISVKIFDPTGRLIYNKNENEKSAETEFDMSAFSPGIYFLRINTGEKIYTRQIEKF